MAAALFCRRSLLRASARLSFRQTATISEANASYKIAELFRRAQRLRESGHFMSHEFANEFGRFYVQLNQVQRKQALRSLGADFGINVEALRQAVHSFAHADQEATLTVNDRRLFRQLQPLERALTHAHSTLFSTLSQLPDGMELILQMRADLLTCLRDDGNDVSLRSLDNALKSQLQAWFALGFLDLRAITWNTSALILEKIIKYEAVHSIADWNALKQRLVGPNRHCFGFFHPSLPSEPLVFVEVALTKEISGSIQSILNEQAPVSLFSSGFSTESTTAVFYSITSTQPGLSGVDLGNYLIKNVVKRIQAMYSRVNTFVTLSPLPGFSKWLASQAAKDDLLTHQEQESLRFVLGLSQPVSSVLTTALSVPNWHSNNQLATALQPILMRLGARYLYLEKHRQLALDPVANFHIRNGAWLWRLNWLADVSPKGIKQSHTLMVNYRYILEDIDRNNQLYLEKGTIAVSEQIALLLNKLENK